MPSLYDTGMFKIVIFFFNYFLRLCYECFEALFKQPALFDLRCI